jgi:predicted nucleotide-binding protein
MPTYQPTEEEQGLIRDLEEFRELLSKWRRTDRPDERERFRSQINRRLEAVAETVRLAGCRQTMTISPPPMVGGMVMQGVDPFNYIFEDVYGRSLNSVVRDMLDQTIGVIESGKFEERKSRLKRTRGPLGPISGKKVFVVHGHDESARETVARFLERLDLEPIILHEQASSGRTIIEKVERYSEVAFAVVLLTPDDVGASKGKEGTLNPRARQNVILELGYFLGKLGRTHVTGLIKGDLEKPSDYDGVVYIQLDGPGAWRLQLARELKAAGLDVDLNKAV